MCYSPGLPSGNRFSWPVRATDPGSYTGWKLFQIAPAVTPTPAPATVLPNATPTALPTIGQGTPDLG
jgi:hypothetical protein